MAIYLDDELLNMDCANWGALLDAAQARVSPAVRVIIEIRRGQEVLDIQTLDANRAQPIGADEIRIYTGNLSDLATSALHQIVARLDEARALQAQAADLIQRGQTKESMAIIAQVMEAWQQAHMGIAQTTIGFGIEPGTVRHEGHSLAAFLPIMIAALRSLRDMLSLHDWVGVADALGHDWPTMTDRGQALIAELARRVADGK